jgi:hypothetical protein
VGLRTRRLIMIIGRAGETIRGATLRDIGPTQDAVALPLT